MSPQLDSQGLEPGGVDEKGRLAGDGVEADNVPEEPDLHGAGVVVAGEAAFAGAIVLFGDAARVSNGEVGAVNVMVEVGDVEHSV